MFEVDEHLVSKGLVGIGSEVEHRETALEAPSEGGIGVSLPRGFDSAGVWWWCKRRESDGE